MQEKLLVLGDSLARGVVFSKEKGRYAVCPRSMAALAAQNAGLDLVNASKFGMTADYGAQKLPDLLERHRPTRVLIEFGGNDCDFDWPAVAEDPQADHQCRVPLERFEEKMRGMCDQVNNFGAKLILMTLPPLNAPAYFKWFTGGDEEKARRVLLWLGDVGRIYWWHERYSLAVRRLAQAAGAALADVRSELMRGEDYRVFIGPDGIHMNEAGQERAAQVLLGALSSQ